MRASLFARLSVLVFLGCWCCASAVAGETEFDFKDPKGVNSISFVLDSALEPIMGVATGITGKVKFDPANPKALSGKISIDAKKLSCAMPGMTNVVQGEDWLDVGNHPSIDFAFKSVRKVEGTEGDKVDMTVVGEMTCKGVTQEIVVPVSVTYLPDQMENRMRGAKGDLLVLRSTFSISRKAFGIKPKMGPSVVADEIELRVSIVGGKKK